MLPNTRPFPVPGKMTGKIPIGRKVSRRYSPDRCTTASCSVIWRNVALAVMDNGSDTCNLFEGFIDCLSWMQLELGCGDDYLVLNSVALLERSFPVLDRYERVNCYLDRDEAGRRTLEALRKRYADKIVDCSSLYKGYKDLNEYLQNKFL